MIGNEVLFRRKTMTSGTAVAVLLSGLCGVPRLAQSSEAVEVQQVRSNFYMISGAGANIGVQVGSDGLVLVDAGNKEASAEVLSEIRKLSKHPIRYIINTCADPDHVGGNAAIAKAGQTIFTAVSGPGADFAKAMTGGAASILAYQTVLSRMSAPTGKAAPFSAGAWPTETFEDNPKTLYFNHEGIEVLHQPAAHTDGDSFVLFRGSDVIMAGDILDTTRFPMIDLEKGGSIQGEIDALNRLIDLAISPTPFIFQQAGTYVIPGHGRIYDQSDVVEYRDMIVIIRDVIQDMMKRGMTLDQIKAADPVFPYENQYGAKSGSWTTSDFIEAVYKSLAAKK